jgi:hypothetical protein
MISRSLSDHVKKIWSSTKAVLFANSMPVWLSLTMSIIAAIAAFYGTYDLVPKINQELKVQEIRTQYLVENIQAINDDTRIILSSTTILSREVFQNSVVDEEICRKILGKMTELQWSVLNLDVIFVDEPAKDTLRNYRKSLSEFRRSIEKLEEQDDFTDVYDTSHDFSVSAYRTLQTLYRMAGLQISVSPFESPKK